MGSDLLKMASGGGPRDPKTAKPAFGAEYISGKDGIVGPIPGKLTAEGGIMRFNGVQMTGSLTSKPFDIEIPLADVAAVSTGRGAAAMNKDRTATLQIAVRAGQGWATYVFAVEPADAPLGAQLARSVVGNVPEVTQLTATRAAAGTEQVLMDILVELREQTRLLRALVDRQHHGM